VTSGKKPISGNRKREYEVFDLTFLPARFGDSILLEYGEAPETNLVLLDGGTGGTRHDIKRRLRRAGTDALRGLELLVVSHIDRDHIEGVLRFLEESGENLQVDQVWFNGWSHLPDNPEDEHFGAVQGERLSQIALDLAIPWNQSFEGKSVTVPEAGELPVKELPGGLELTLLTPGSSELAELKVVWEAEVRDANLDPGFGMTPNDEEDEEDEPFAGEDPPDVEALAQTDFDGDDSEANGSSIAFLAEFEGKRVLMAADAHAGDLVAALDRVSPDERVSVDLFKVSHHGSKRTTSRALVEKVDCSRYVFSTNGSIFKHPDHEAVARVIKFGGPNPELLFNYRNSRNEIWDLGVLKDAHGYTTRYPEIGETGLTISV
jgi:beta-lactamase superfamily II metal-dependent hydrolase